MIDTTRVFRTKIPMDVPFRPSFNEPYPRVA